jgi:tetratricopeptide (TPR) repeat protein
MPYHSTVGERPTAEPCPEDDAILQFVEGALPEPGAGNLKGHIDRCPICRVAVAETFRFQLKGSGDAPTGADSERYQLVQPIGAGGMGIVYVARDRKLDRRVALKLLHGALDDAAGARLDREAQTMARLSHPNVVAIYDTGVWDDRRLVSMELVEGRSLRAWLQEGRHGWREALAVLLGAGEGLAAAHQAGVIHQDLKPENVLVGWDGRARVGDFGLARLEGAREGAVAGTPLYMAPEQRAGGEATFASDQYAFGLILDEALLAAGKAPRWLHRIADRATREAPGDRYSSMRALLEDLGEGLSRARWLRAAGWGAAAGIALGVAGYGFARWGEGPCRGGGRIEDAWGPAHRAAVTDAFTMRALDGYAQRWRSAYAEACEATHRRGEQSDATLAARMRCLDRRRIELGALVGVLGRGDARVAARGPESVARLPGLEACSAVTVLAAKVAATGDPAAVAAAERRLAEATALRDTGQYPAAGAALDAVIAEGRRLGHAALEAEALLARGHLLFETREPKAAEMVLFEAFRLASSAGADRLAAEAAILLVRVDGRWLGKPEEARRWGGLAEAALERSGGSRELEGRLRVAEGHVDLQSGAREDALRKRQRGVELLVEALGPGHPDVADALADLCYNQYATRKMEPDLGSCRRAAEVLEEAYGPDHPLMARALASLALSLGALGDHAGAAERLARALALTERAHGPDHLDVALHALNLGDTLDELGNHTEAERHIRRAMAIYEKALGPGHLDLAHVWLNLSRNQLIQGRIDAGVAAGERALAIWSENGQPEHPSSVEALTALGGAELQRRRPQAALARFQRAREVAERAFGPDHFSAGDALSSLGEAQLALGRARQAVDSLERALAIREATEGTDPLLLAETRFTLARALAGSGGDRLRARALAEEARSAWSGAGESGRLAEAEAWLRRLQPR